MTPEVSAVPPDEETPLFLSHVISPCDRCLPGKAPINLSPSRKKAPPAAPPTVAWFEGSFVQANRLFGARREMPLAPK